MEFEIENCVGQKFLVDAVKEDGNNDCLWCMVYKGSGQGDYFADFTIYREKGLNIEDYDEVADYIQENFYDPEWYREHIDSNFVSDDEEDMSETPSAGIRYFEDRGKKLLEKYHKLDLERMAVADCRDALAYIAEEMADFITDFVYSE